VDSLVEDKGLNDIDPGVLVEMKNDLLNRIEDRLNMVIVKNMPEANIAEFDKMMDENKSDEEVQKYCEEKIPDLEALIAVEIARFRDIYLGK
jgi:hypothetical protein